MPLPTADESRVPLAAPATAGKTWLWVASGLAATAAGISAYLAWAAIAAGGRVAGCGGVAGDCAGVLTSRWARWFNLPLGVPSTAVYLLLLVVLCTQSLRAKPGEIGEARPRSFLGWYVLLPLATLVLLSAAWLTSLQWLVIGKVCWYCLAVHACGAVLALLVFWHVPHDWRLPEQRQRGPIGLSPVVTAALVCGGMLGACVLVGGQLASQRAAAELEITAVDAAGEATPAVDPGAKTAKGKPTAGEKFPADLSSYFRQPGDEAPEAKGPPRRISLFRGQAVLDARRVPLLGDPDARVVLVELFDYTCPHCRRLHQIVSEALRRYGDQLAVVPLVTPMDPACNRHVHEPASEPGSCELARLAVAVWQNRPGDFAAFHDWLLDTATTRPLTEARARASGILGGGVVELTPDVLDRTLADRAITRQLDADNHLYQLAGEGTLPKLISERLIIAGEPASAAALFEVLEKQLELEPLPAAER
ncbi:MAG TPA: vitamin K epoxide reductase family protein [Pirellulales bacterium]|nr:vitamin K epoxide reductase family protein [Pirellulales bacterium]